MSNIFIFVCTKTLNVIIFLRVRRMLTRGFNFFAGEKEKLSSCTDAVACGGGKASSFAIFSIANVLDFVRGLAMSLATDVLCDSIVCRI